MSLEVGEHEKRIIVREVLTDVVFLYNLAVGNVENLIFSFRVKKVDLEVLAPAVLFEGFKVLFGGVA